MKARLFAEGTLVSEQRSRAEIEALVTRYGAKSFGVGVDETRAAVIFEAKDRKVRFTFAIPKAGEHRFTRVPGNPYRPRPTSVARKLWEAEKRRLWRALLIVLKAKLESVASGITTFDEEFLAHILLPGGGTVGEQIGPRLADAYERGVSMPPLLGSGA